MTLPSSGSISLNQMHVEVGGSSGTACSLNDSDIRGLIGKGSGVAMSFSEWYGASAFTADTQIQITPADTGVKHSNHSFSTYSSGIMAGSHGTVHDNHVSYSQGTSVYIHSAGGSSLMGNQFHICWNGSTTAAGGGSSAGALNGKYWRTGNIGGTGNPGNHLLGNGSLSTSRGGATGISIYCFSGTSTGSPVGIGTTTMRTIQIY